jgi:hypothetical protein
MPELVAEPFGAEDRLIARSLRTIRSSSVGRLAVHGVMLPYFAATRAGGDRIVRTRIFRLAACREATPLRPRFRSSGWIWGFDLVVRPGDENALIAGGSKPWLWPDSKLAKAVRRR